jgi:heme-degrading monooxygenase HmoA
MELLDILARATDASVRDVPGFISAALHRSVDGTKVTIYLQWKSAGHYQHYQSMRSDPVASPYVEQALAIAKFDPGMYEVGQGLSWAILAYALMPQERHSCQANSR